MRHRVQPDLVGRSRKSRALLAGGAILGLGATATLAAWSDEVWVGASFNTDTFNVQGISNSTDGWGDHSSANSPAIFEPELGSVVPGSTRSYSRFGLRMAPGSTAGATVTIPRGVEVSTPSKAVKFRMRIVRSLSDTCGLESFGSDATFVVGSPVTNSPDEFGTMISAPTSVGDSHQISLPAGSPPSEAGAAVYLCYEFSLPSLPIDGLTNGDTTTVRWNFDAVSS
ncbi:SipW-dependent-type signal peptide-containing protein [Dietzia kunjamensis]|uniref:SipW-dependent-type signal peptide-containing protein n=1 Tax=Dietzia kunjamensis TaxID=322509 RepID=UPI0038559B75